MKIYRLFGVLLAGALLLGLPSGVLSAENAAGEAGTPDGGAMLQNPAAPEQKGEAAAVDFSYASPEEMLQGMNLACENDEFALYYSRQNMAVALLEKDSARVYSTNPYHASLDADSVGNTEKALESQAVLTYIDVNERQQILELYSSSDCVELGQFSYTEYADGVMFSLSVGKDAGERLVPPAMTEARFEEIVSQLEGRPARRMGIFYTRYSLEDELSEEEKAALVSQYPGIQNGAVYVALDLSERESSEVEGYLKELGYTVEDMRRDMEEIGVQLEETSFPNFRFHLEYILTEDGLTVNIPNDSISYDVENYQLLSVRLLPFFGCDEPVPGGEGYLFFPDGSGSVIEMDGQDEKRRRLMTTAVYGFDAGDELAGDARAGEPCYVPVFGVHRNDRGGFVAVIESGDEVASITAQLGEPNGSFYTVYSTFTLANEKHVERDSKVSSLGSKQMVYLFETGRTPYSGNLTISYHILPEGDSGYSGMAARYREYLLSQGMTEKAGAESLEAAVETIGTALYPADFLGFTLDSEAELTRYGQNIAILRELIDEGAQDLTLLLSGWQKDGLDKAGSGTVKLSSALGGKADFTELLNYAKEQGVRFYPDVDLLFVTRDTLFDGFSANSDGIRQLDRTLGGIAEYRPDIDDFDDLHTGISPQRYAGYFRSFFNSFSKYGVSSVSLGTVGSYLNSDYSRKHTANRGETREILEALLQEYSRDYDLAFSGANAYVLPYASRLNEISMTDSNYLGESYPVPFVQLAVSGCMSVQSPAINLEEDMDRQILRCIETRTAPKFVVCYDNTELLKQTDYSRYYSVRFSVQKEHILDAYRQYTQALGPTEGSRMTAHEQLADGVFVSFYENGAKVYVNYNDAEYQSGDVTVAPHSYAVTAPSAPR